MATAETHAINPSIYVKLRYDAVSDFSPIGSIASVPLFLVTNVDVAEKSFPELMSAAAKTPQRFKYASWGAGSTGHLAFELLNAPAHVEMIHVPYKGLGPALLDVAEETRRTGYVPFVVPDVLKLHQDPASASSFTAGPTAIWGDAAVWVPQAMCCRASRSTRMPCVPTLSGARA